MRSKHALCLAFLFAAGALPALAGDNKPEAADQGLGAALMSAAVAANGTLLGGSGAVSVMHSVGGFYLVFFNRDLTGCHAVVSPGSASPTASVQIGSATVNTGPYANSSKDHVEVFLRDGLGNPADLAFMVIVFCSK